MSQAAAASVKGSVAAVAESAVPAASLFGSPLAHALLRHVVISTGSGWGVWCVPQPGGPDQTDGQANGNNNGNGSACERFSVLWCDAGSQVCVREWSGDDVRRVFGSVLASGLPAVTNDVPSAWSAWLTGDVPLCVDGWHSMLAVALADIGSARALLGLANREDGYEAAHIEAWQPVFDTLAAVSQAEVSGLRAPVVTADTTPVSTVPAERATSGFLSRMSHELRTPLNAVLGFAQLLRADASQPLSVAQRGKLEHIEKAGGHLMAILGEVLDFARIEAGELSLSLETLRVGSVIDDALAAVEQQARATGIHLRYTPPASGSEEAAYCVRGDLARLRQVLTSLLSCAVTFSLPGGSVKVKVAREATHAASAGDHIVITVADGGAGLSAEQQERLFEPFGRVGGERPATEGSGIGLVVVRKLVELMGGDLAVHSEIGRGTRFVLRLPAVGAPPEPQAPSTGDADAPLLVSEPMPSEQPDAADEEGPHAFTVLYAEDNEVNVELVRQVMRMRPTYRLLVAHSGAQAIELVRAQRPDVLLLDMHLGDMTGIDVVTVLDREPATAGIPRLALSADALPDHIRAARAYGFDIYLTKPLDVSALLRSLDDFGQAGEANAS